MKLLTILFILAIMGCEYGEPKYVAIQKTYDVTDGLPLKEYEIDGCQYLGKLRGYESDVLSHKGNCTNPIHKSPCE